MKAQFKTLATLLLIFITSAAFSIDPPNKKNVQLLPAEAGKIKVIYFNPKAENVTVKIRNIHGVLLTDKIDVEEDGFARRYDLSKIECEELSIEVSDEDTSTRFRVIQDPLGNLIATYWHQPANQTQLLATK